LNKKNYILAVAAITGFILFIALRPQFDLHAGGAIAESRFSVEEKTRLLTGKLGFSVDSLGMFTVREQHTGYLKTLEDTAGGSGFNLKKLNQNGVNLSSWLVTIADQVSDNNSFFTPAQIFNSTGRVQLRFDNEGKVIRLRSTKRNSNPIFLKGDSLSTIAKYVVEEVFMYDLSRYVLSNVELPDSAALTEDAGVTRQFENSDGRLGNTVEYTWKLRAGLESAEELLTLSLTPVIRETTEDFGVRIDVGAAVESFSARNTLEPEKLEQSMVEEISGFTLFFFVAAAVIGFFAFFTGIKALFRGEVILQRGLFMLISIALAIYGWRAIYVTNTFDEVLNSTGVIIFHLNQFIYGLVMGLFAAAAYLGWEAMSRKTNHPQLPLVDNIWEGKLYLKELGAGTLKGYALGGILVGLTAILFFIFDITLVQADSQFGFSEPSNSPKILTMNLATWSAVWLISVAQIGVVYTLFAEWIKVGWIRDLAVVLVSGFSLTFLGRMMATPENVWIDLSIYTVLAAVLIYFYKKEGIVSVAFGWWVFLNVILITPYAGSSAIEVASTAWIQSGILLLPVMYGFLVHRYGYSVHDLETFIPEYQQRFAKHTRVEKEIEIARESQYKLMPLKPPYGNGFDVYGFFLPSYEVGGDFFDYLSITDAEGNVRGLTMVVVDVSGKSMRAAMPAVFTSGLLLSRMHDDNPAHMLRQVTGPLYQRTDRQTFITCLVGRYETESGKLTLSNAGHCLPLLKRNGKAEFIRTPEPRFPLGIRPEVEYQCLELTLTKGDVILFYSDGLPEAENEDGQQFGFEQVKSLLESINTDELTAQEIAQQIKKAIQKFSDHQLADDTTVICLKV